MDELGLENVQNRCRICFTDLSDETTNFVEVNCHISDETKVFTYSELFRQISGYPIMDHEPQKICRWCGEVLVQLRQLMKKADETQVLLETMLKARNESPVPEDDPGTGFSESESPDEVFIEDESVKRSVKSKNARFKCDFCSKSFKTNKYRLLHMQKQHGEQGHQCEYCHRRFRTLERLHNHQNNCKSRQRTEDERLNDKSLHVCPVCGNLSTADHIRHHTKTTTNKDRTSHKSYICDMCGITASTRSNIDMHMRVQHLSIRSKCRHCPGNFKNPSALARHMRKSHSEKLQDYKCRTCDFRTSVEKLARNHRESHRLKKLVCQVCGQEFHKTINLRYHMASHSDQRPYSCETCGSAFKTTKALGAHKKTHKAYDYECPVCGRSYLTNQLMRSHVEKNHPEYELPPPGTVFSKSYRMKMAERKLKEMAIKQGIDVTAVDTVIVPDTVIDQVQSIHVVQ